jgi:hypothetical protein
LGKANVSKAPERIVAAKGNISLKILFDNFSVLIMKSVHLMNRFVSPRRARCTRRIHNVRFYLCVLLALRGLILFGLRFIRVRIYTIALKLN